MNKSVCILGGFQTDFSKVWSRNGEDISDMIREVTYGAMKCSGVDASQIQSVHVGHAFAELNYGYAKSNPNAQPRKWNFDPLSFTDSDEVNPIIEPGTRRMDCSQISNCACALLLTPERFAAVHLKAGRRNRRAHAAGRDQTGDRVGFIVPDRERKAHPNAQHRRLVFHGG